MLQSRKSQLWALFGVTFVSHLGWTVLSPVLPLIQSEFALSAVKVSLVSSVYGLSRLLTALPTGFLSDRIGHRRLLQAGCVILTVGSLVGALSSNFTVLLVSRLFSGVGACLMVVTNMVLVTNLSDPDHRGRDLGAYQASSQLGTAFSPALAGILATWGGWRSPLWFAAVTAIAALVVISSMPGLGRSEAQATTRKKTAEEKVSVPVHLPSIIAAQFVTFALFFGASTFSSTFVPLFGKEVLGLSSFVLGLVLSMGASLRFVVSIGGGHVSDRWGRRILIVTGLVLTAIGMLIVTGSSGLTWFLFGMGLLSFGRIGNSVPNTVLADHLPQHRWGMAMAGNRFLGDLGLVLGPTVMGLIIDQAGMTPAGLTLTAMVVISAIAALAIRETVAGQSRPPASRHWA